MMVETACFETSEETQYTVLCKNPEDQLLLHIFVFLSSNNNKNTLGVPSVVYKAYMLHKNL